MCHLSFRPVFIYSKRIIIKSHKLERIIFINRLRKLVGLVVLFIYFRTLSTTFKNDKYLSCVRLHNSCTYIKEQYKYYRMSHN